MRREKLALLGQLASGVGHELRNPLGVMSNAVYYLDRVQRDAPPDIRKISACCGKHLLSAKINHLLDFSRVTPAERSLVELAELAKRQLERVKPLNGIRVEEDFPDHLPRVHVDPVHAGQVVLNLVTNAVQAMGKSRLSASVGRVIRRTARCCSSSDTGPGVAPEKSGQDFRAAVYHQGGGHRARAGRLPITGPGQRRRPAGGQRAGSGCHVLPSSCAPTSRRTRSAPGRRGAPGRSSSSLPPRNAALTGPSPSM